MASVTHSRPKGRRAAIVRGLKKLHAGEEVLYTGCRINCGGSQCVLRVRRRDGVVTAIEPDDPGGSLRKLFRLP